MTTREKIDTLLDELSEAELEAQYERLRAAVATERDTDQWGDLDSFSVQASSATRRRLDTEEASEGFSWEEPR